MSKPRNWPPSLPYLTQPLLDKGLDTAQLQFLRTKPTPSSSSASSVAATSSTLTTIPASATPIPNSLVKIQPISDPSHPAHGQHGLFAARDLKPGTWIVTYLGRVHPDTAAATDPYSDYDLWLDRDRGVAVDAAKAGNEARFVNDYRGVKAGEAGPNAEFGTAWCDRWGQRCVGFVVRDGGGGGSGKAKGKGKSKGKDRGIKKGEEILVSYGKGFWEERRLEEETMGDDEGDNGEKTPHAERETG